MKITKDNYPKIFEAFETISHDRGTQAGHSHYYVPTRWDAHIPSLEEQLGKLDAGQLNEFCIGEGQTHMDIAVAFGIEQASLFLNDFFNEWEQDNEF